MNGTINELKQGLLKCANENEDRTYFHRTSYYQFDL